MSEAFHGMTGNLLAGSTYDFLLREETFISARQANVGMDVSGDKEKDQFASSGLLLQRSSLSAVYRFQLLRKIQKYRQINPEFSGEATKSCASSAPTHVRAGSWR